MWNSFDFYVRKKEDIELLLTKSQGQQKPSNWGKNTSCFLEKKKKEFWEIKSLWPQPWFGDLFRSGLPSLKYLFLVPTRNQDCFTWKQLTWIVPCSSIPTGPKCLETLVWRNRWQSLFCTPVLISSLLKYNADARYWNWLGINTVFQMIS